MLGGTRRKRDLRYNCENRLGSRNALDSAVGCRGLVDPGSCGVRGEVAELVALVNAGVPRSTAVGMQRESAVGGAVVGTVVDEVDVATKPRTFVDGGDVPAGSVEHGY